MSSSSIASVCIFVLLVALVVCALDDGTLFPVAATSEAFDATPDTRRFLGKCAKRRAHRKRGCVKRNVPCAHGTRLDASPALFGNGHRENPPPEKRIYLVDRSGDDVPSLSEMLESRRWDDLEMACVLSCRENPKHAAVRRTT